MPGAADHEPYVKSTLNISKYEVFCGGMFQYFRDYTGISSIILLVYSVKTVMTGMNC